MGEEEVGQKKVLTPIPKAGEIAGTPGPQSPRAVDTVTSPPENCLRLS